MGSSNKRHAKRAKAALKTGTDYDGSPDTAEIATYTGDLIANLRHLCDDRGIDFDDCLRRGQLHYMAEIQCYTAPDKRVADYTEPRR